MDKITKIPGPDRPESIMLIKAIESSITNIALGKMTPIEVLGVLSLVEKTFYSDYFCGGVDD